MKSVKRLLTSIFIPFSFNSVQKLILEENSFKTNKKLFEDGLFKKVTKKLKNPECQKDVLETVFILLTHTSDRKSDILQFLLESLKVNSPVKGIESLNVLYQIINHFLFNFQELQEEEVKKLIDYTREIIEFIDKEFKDDLDKKVDLLIKVYFGIQFVACYTVDYQSKKAALHCFDRVLEIIQDAIFYLETTFFFDEKKKFLRMSLEYRGNPVFSSYDEKISEFYFKLIRQIIFDNDKAYRNVNRWAEGNLLSVFSSIKEEKLSIVSTQGYLHSICSIAMNQNFDENIIFALKSLKRVCSMSRECKFTIDRYFSKRFVNIEKIFNLIETAQKLDGVVLFQIKNVLSKDMDFKNNLLKNSSAFNNITIHFQ